MKKGALMYKIVENILKKNFIKYDNILSIGHQELNRNHVFLIRGEKEYILNHPNFNIDPKEIV